MIDQLFGNSVIKKALTARLLKLAKENNIKAIVLTVSEAGDIDGKIHHEDVVVMTKSEFENLLKSDQ